MKAFVLFEYRVYTDDVVATHMVRGGFERVDTSFLINTAATRERAENGFFDSYDLVLFVGGTYVDKNYKLRTTPPSDFKLHLPNYLPKDKTKFVFILSLREIDWLMNFLHWQKSVNPILDKFSNHGYDFDLLLLEKDFSCVKPSEWQDVYEYSKSLNGKPYEGAFYVNSFEKFDNHFSIFTHQDEKLERRFYRFRMNSDAENIPELKFDPIAGKSKEAFDCCFPSDFPTIAGRLERQPFDVRWEKDILHISSNHSLMLFSDHYLVLDKRQLHVLDDLFGTDYVKSVFDSLEPGNLVCVSSYPFQGVYCVYAAHRRYILLSKSF